MKNPATLENFDRQINQNRPPYRIKRLKERFTHLQTVNRSTVTIPDLTPDFNFIFWRKKLEQKSKRFIGIDLGKTKYTVKIIHANGKVTGWEGKTTTAGRYELYKQLKETDRIGIEVCSLAMKMVNEMKSKVGCDIAMMDAHQLAVIYNSTKKNDKEDALKLARLVQKNSNDELPVVNLPTQQETKRRNLLTENKELKQSRTQEINRLHAIYLRTGFTEVVKKNLATRINRETTSKLLKGFDLKQALRIMERINLIEDDIQIVEEEIKEEVKDDKNIELLESVPGVGKLTAMAYVAYIGNGSRFHNASQVEASIGLVPKIDMSGTINRHGAISKHGCGYLRSLLVMASWSLIRSKTDCALKAKYKYMVKCQSKNKRKAIVAVARKLSELLYIMLKTGKKFETRSFKPPIQNITGMLEIA